MRVIVYIFFVLASIFPIAGMGESQGASAGKFEKRIDGIINVLRDPDIELEEALSALVSLRYYQSLNDKQVQELIEAFDYKGAKENGWNEDLVKSHEVKILLAELIWKKARDQDYKYLNYVRSMLGSSIEIPRAYAALSLGKMRSTQDICRLKEMVLEDSEMPATKAGLSLISMQTASAEMELKSALSVVCTRSYPRDLKVCRPLSEYIRALSEYKGKRNTPDPGLLPDGAESCE
ncbi:hypothetical protein [Microbulbifer sp. JTAC008]|uniref:hypothetical protein n=1 Tax=unclassified Microbulbifer TaxID=2619833 RepID=UPI00403A5471